jgi:hypothetical protein
VIANSIGNNEFTKEIDFKTGINIIAIQSKLAQ